MKKKILFIGLGGAGQRHLRIIYNQYGNIFDYFAYRKMRKTNYLDKNFNHYSSVGLETIYPISYIPYLSIKKINFDFVFISNPTAYHYKFLTLFFNKKTKILIEKPLVFSLNKFSVIKNSKANIFLGYQRRLMPIFLDLSSEIKKNYKKIQKISINVNSYVPYWHKYENYKDLYACKKSLGGGALLTECHEIDMILNILGLPKTIKCSLSTDKRFNLNIDTKFKLIANYGKFNVIFNVNMFSKNIKRTFSIFYEKNIFSEYDLNNNCKLNSNSKSKNYLDSNKIDPFKKQIDLFFKSKNSYFKNELKLVYMNNFFLKKSLQSANSKRMLNL